MSKKIHGGDILIKCLLEENVKYLFGIPGGQLLPMYDAIYQWGRVKGINISPPFNLLDIEFLNGKCIFNFEF